MDNKRTALDAVPSKQWQVIILVPFAVVCKVQKGSVFSTQVADFIFIVRS